MLTRIHERLRQFTSDRSGTAAIEFAFVAPVMVAGLLVLTDLGKMVIDRTDMQSAARSGAQYLMNGGSNMEVARSIVLASWSSKPADAEVVAERYCLCGTAQHACNTLCPDETIPEGYGRIRLEGTLTGLWSDTEQNADEAVRVR